MMIDINTNKLKQAAGLIPVWAITKSGISGSRVMFQKYLVIFKVCKKDLK